jgi:hypothetical protein
MAGRFVERRWSPSEFGRFTAVTGLDEDAALAWLDSLTTDDVDAAARFVRRWQAADLPGNPPPGAYRFADRDPAELRAWLAAGFDLYAAHQLALAGLDRALLWRRAGFTPAQTYELLHSDPTLTPAEAHAFEAVGIADPRRSEWIYYGFDAEQAAAWTAAGVSPEEARLWRAAGNQPADVLPGRRLPPQLTAGRRYVFANRIAGRMSYPDWDGLPDPPGTRGRRARRWAHDDDPWINTD